MPLPVKRCGWPPPPDSSWPHTRSCRRQVCCGDRARCAGRRVSRWEGAYGANVGCPCLSPHAHHLYTTRQWVLDGPRPYSSAWPAHPSTRSGLMGAPQSAGDSPPDGDENLGNARNEGISEVGMQYYTHWWRTVWYMLVFKHITTPERNPGSLHSIQRFLNTKSL